MVKNNSALSLYYKDVGGFELLSKEEESELGKQVKAGGNKSKEAVKKLVESNLRLVVKIAQDFKGRGLDLEDLINEGNQGLMTAAKKFNPEKGARFSYYSSFWIRQNIFRAIANQGRLIRIPSNSLDKFSKILAFISSYKDEFNTRPSMEEIAEHFKYPVARVKQIMVAAESCIPLDSKISPDGEVKIHDIIPDENLNPFESCSQRDDHDKLKSLLNKLSNREVYIIKHRFGLGDNDKITLEELGKKLNVTRERVRQIEGAALTKLKSLSGGKITR